MHLNHLNVRGYYVSYILDFHVKPLIHEATMLPATVACNNVAMSTMQCCVVACCRQLLLTFRLQFCCWELFSATTYVASCMGAFTEGLIIRLYT